MARQPQFYSLNQSPLYKLQSKQRLATLLQMPIKDIYWLLDQDDNYKQWDTQQKAAEKLCEIAHKSRRIQEPKKILEGIQNRLAKYLGRIERPDYLYSATKGRSHVLNALAHKKLGLTIKIDIKNFYQNATSQNVRTFFERHLECSPDVAYILEKISTFNGHLPTGSPLSPALSFFAYKDMFDHLNKIALSTGATMTLYVDDIVVSGDGATPALINRMRSALKKHGLIGHKVSCFRNGELKVITGVAVTDTVIAIPYKRRNKMRIMENVLRSSNNAQDIQIIGRALIGQYREAGHIEPGIERRADYFERIVEGAIISIRSISDNRDTPTRVSRLG